MQSCLNGTLTNTDSVRIPFSSRVKPYIYMHVPQIIHKKGDPLDISNYRPISLLSSISKVLEKIIHKRTIRFLKNLDIFSDSQFGFRQKHSTTHAILYFIDHIASAIDDHLHTLGIFLDLSKAFDTIDYEILLYKLSH